MEMLSATVLAIVLVAAAVVTRLRARRRWVSPYADLAQAMRTVTRTEENEFQAAAGLVQLRPAPFAHTAEVVDLRRERALRARHPAAV